MSKATADNSRGFTIVELLIAMVVFGVVLLTVTFAILQLSRVYYKGVTEANTQTIARSIVDRVAQSIQLNGGPVLTTPGSTAGTIYHFCVGNQQYTYKLGRQVVDSAPGADQTYHALVVRDLAGCTATSPKPSMDTAATTGTELLAPKMRLAKLTVTNPSSNLYQVSIKVVYGDLDLLDNPTTSAAKCKPIRAGTQFCAISDITTLVTKRLE